MLSYTDIYNTLESTQRRTDNGVRYWLLSDLNKLYHISDGDFNDQRWVVYTHFKSNPTVQKLTQAHGPHAPKLEDLFQGHVAPVASGASDSDAPTDMKLTRFAAWAVIADITGTGTLFGQTYMLYPDDNLAELVTRTHEFARLDYRAQLAHTRRIVNGILYATNGVFGEFNNLIHTNFYNGTDADTLKRNHHIPIKNDDPLSNYMGVWSLMLRNIALRETIDRFDRMPGTPSANAFMMIAAQQLRQARQTMKIKHDITPEQDLRHINIKKVQSQWNQAIRDFAAYYADRTL